MAFTEETLDACIMRNKKRHREQNREWFYKWRARGLCYICKKPMADDDMKVAHTECYRKKNKEKVK